MISITPTGRDVAIRIRGAFDDRAVDQVCAVISDLIARGGTITDVELDLGSTTGCSTSALESVGALVGAGMRLSDVRDDRRDRSQRPRHRPKTGHRDDQRQASHS